MTEVKTFDGLTLYAGDVIKMLRIGYTFESISVGSGIDQDTLVQLIFDRQKSLDKYEFEANFDQNTRKILYSAKGYNFDA
jgi:hypothetical protein